MVCATGQTPVQFQPWNLNTFSAGWIEKDFWCCTWDEHTQLLSMAYPLLLTEHAQYSDVPIKQCDLRPRAADMTQDRHLQDESVWHTSDILRKIFYHLENLALQVLYKKLTSNTIPGKMTRRLSVWMLLSQLKHKEEPEECEERQFAYLCLGLGGFQTKWRTQTGEDKPPRASQDSEATLWWQYLFCNRSVLWKKVIIA